MVDFHNYLKNSESKMILANAITVGIQKQLKESWARKFCRTTNLPDKSLSVVNLDGKRAYYLQEDGKTVQKIDVSRSRLMVPIFEISDRLSFSTSQIKQMTDNVFWESFRLIAKNFEEQEKSYAGQRNAVNVVQNSSRAFCN